MSLPFDFPSASACSEFEILVVTYLQILQAILLLYAKRLEDNSHIDDMITSGISRVYLLQGPRVGSRDRSETEMNTQTLSLSPPSPSGPTLPSLLTIVKSLHISLHLLQTGLSIIEGSQTNVPLYLGPWGNLVHRTLRTPDLSWLHCRRSRKLVALLVSMLWDEMYTAMYVAL